MRVARIERSEMRGRRSRIARSLSSGWPKARPGGSIRATSCVLLLALLSSCSVKGPAPLCILDPAAMPESWRPSGARQKTLSTAPWSAEESKDALHAINRGMAELTGFFAYRPAAIAVLRDDAVEAFIDLSYAA